MKTQGKWVPHPKMYVFRKEDYVVLRSKKTLFPMTVQRVKE
jgi:hypothetical protein